MAMAEAEEAVAAAARSGPGNGCGVSELVKAAVDGSLTQTFTGESVRGRGWGAHSFSCSPVGDVDRSPTDGCGVRWFG